MTESLIVGYAPGAWRVVATAHGVVMVDAAVPPTTVAALWTTLAEKVDLHRVLDALTVGTGGTLATLPSFAVVLREDGATRVAVRGAVIASATGGAGAVELSGEGVTTWNERLVVAGAVRVAAIDAAEASFDLALRDGVVLADSIHVRWVDGVETAVPAAPAEGVQAASAPAVVAPTVEAPAEPASTASAPAEVPTDDAPAEPQAEPAASTPVAAEQPARPVVGQPYVPPVAAVAAPPVIAPVAGRPVVGQPYVPPTAAPAEPDPVVAPAPAEAPIVEPPAPAASVPAAGEPVAPVLPVLAPPVVPWLVDAAKPLVSSAPAAAQLSDDALALADTRVTGSGAVVREPERPGDHDGATISVAEARALRGDRGDTTHPPLAPPRPPAPGRLRLSTGDVVQLDRTVVIGRRPRSTRVTGTDLPRLIPVDSPLHDISRSHVELRVEGDVIVATDLQTTNGTLLLRRATPPTRLHPGEPTVVVPGDVLDLGDGVRVAIEELA